MSLEQDSLSRLVTALVPSLSKSLAEQFNVFRVMHHGTHEKQISNVFAWLLDEDGTHELGDAFQKIFAARVNLSLAEGEHLPLNGYRILQEVDTAGDDASRQDIADIVMTRADANIVVENYGTSDGHQHSYDGYLAHGATVGRSSVVVLLCIRHEPERQTDGWEQATVLTYAELLIELQAHGLREKQWKKKHPQQNFFINELIEHFVEGPKTLSSDERIAFIKTMCETGESVRYGYRPQDTAANEFAELLAQHARQQFEDGRKTLATVKRELRRYAEHYVKGQVNSTSQKELIHSVEARFVGKWEWEVNLRTDDPQRIIGFLFGPTAAMYNELLDRPIADPDFSKLFIVVADCEEGLNRRLSQTDVGLGEVLAGLSSEDDRLAEGVLTMLQQDQRSQL